tara:strand:- start:3746 stop:3961 length:216 start_codon:yes stop_codon:yes gene_type:complete
MTNVLAIFLVAIVGIAIAAGVSLLAAVPTMLLWDWLMPQLFGLGEITFWQAWGLNWFAAILFKTSVTTSSD